MGAMRAFAITFRAKDPKDSQLKLIRDNLAILVFTNGHLKINEIY